MSELWKKIDDWKKNCFEIWEKQEKRAFYSASVLFLSFLHSLLIFWPILTFYTAMESYGHVDHTCFIHFKNLKNEGSTAKKSVIKILNLKSLYSTPSYILYCQIYNYTTPEFSPLKMCFNIESFLVNLENTLDDFRVPKRYYSQEKVTSWIYSNGSSPI